MNNKDIFEILKCTIIGSDNKSNSKTMKLWGFITRFFAWKGFTGIVLPFKLLTGKLYSKFGLDIEYFVTILSAWEESAKSWQPLKKVVTKKCAPSKLPTIKCLKNTETREWKYGTGEYLDCKLLSNGREKHVKFIFILVLTRPMSLRRRATAMEWMWR